MGTNCAPLVADLFLFWYGRDVILSLSEYVIEAFNSAPRYLDDLFYINNNFSDRLSTVFTLQNFN